MTTQRKRCGSCSKCVGTLLPVIVTSGGRCRESWVHEKCAPRWSGIAHVQSDPTREPVTQVALVYKRRRNKVSMPMYRLVSQVSGSLI